MNKSLLLVLLLAGCSTVVPVKQKFPDMPAELTQSCKPLTLIEGEKTTLSKLMETVAKNYGFYHECAADKAAVKEWYQEQKKIFDETNK